VPSVSLRIMNVIPADGYGILPAATPTRDQPVRFVMWPYVDARDAALACVLALEASTQGHQPLFIAASDIRFDCPTQRLLTELAPETVEIRGALPDRASVISIQKAAHLIGYQPQHSWQDRK